MARALRYLDLVLLAAALPVFLAVGLPIAGYVVVAGVWIVMYAIELGADRAIAGAVDRRDRRAAMGWLGATSLASAWMVALAVLLVGLVDGKHAGLAAAVLALILFTVHLGTRVLFACSRRPTSRRAADVGGARQALHQAEGPACRLALYFAITILLLLVAGSQGKNNEFKPQDEFKLHDWIPIHIGPATSRSTRPSSTCCSPAA